MKRPKINREARLRVIYKMYVILFFDILEEDVDFNFGKATINDWFYKNQRNKWTGFVSKGCIEALQSKKQKAGTTEHYVPFSKAGAAMLDRQEPASFKEFKTFLEETCNFNITSRDENYKLQKVMADKSFTDIKNNWKNYYEEAGIELVEGKDIISSSGNLK